jgi:CheY-like chemotaxis protein
MVWSFLVVDGSEADRRESARHLKLLQPAAEILEAATVAEALQLIEGARVAPSFALVEYNLPGMNALELLGEFRHRRWLERVPVVIVSASAPDKAVVLSYRFGARAFLTKPIRAFELREVVRELARPAVQMTAATVISPAGSLRKASAA